jgi:hypothetical protein
MDRALRIATSTTRMLPTVLILGGQKCGTSSLHYHLAEHPDVGEPDRKEVHYFDLNASRSPLWYRSHFPLRGRYAHTLDSSPYYLFHPAVPARARALLPDTKLIVLLRDPVRRSYSHYQHSCARGHETLDFQSAIEQEEHRLEGADAQLLSSPAAQSFSHQHHSYVSRGLYAPQLARWYDCFPREQILVLRSEDLFKDPPSVLRQVQEWLGLSVRLPSSLPPRNVRTYPALDDGLASTLAGRFAADRLEVEQMTGMSFDWRWAQ